MCLAVPALLIERDEYMGTIELHGVQKKISILLVPHANVGDWLLVHAGFAVQVIDEEEAEATMEAFRELEELEEAYAERKIEGC